MYTNVYKYKYKVYKKIRCNAGLTLRMHSSGGNTFLSEMTSWPPSWKYDVKSKIRLSQSTRI